MTGGRLLRLKAMFKENENFFMTYGDGLCDLDLDRLKNFHFNHKKFATVTAVHPPIRFGELEIENEKVKKFKEKPQAKLGWINGGFFVLNPEIAGYVHGNHQWEKEPLTKITKDKELMAFKHEGFWHCMDTPNDVRSLENLWAAGSPAWKTW